MSKREKTQRFCYFCGAIAQSKEHVPPKSFFPENRRENMTTVPSCHEHNNAKSKYDEYVFQLIVSSCAVNPEDELDRYLLKKATSSLTSLKLGGLPQTIHNILEKRHCGVRMEAVKEHPSQAHKSLTYSVEIKYDAVNDFIVSLGKALIFHDKGLIFSANSAVMPHNFGQDQGSSAAKLSADLKMLRAPLSEWQGKYKEIFLYHINDCSEGIIVDMIFYSRFYASVVFGKIEVISPQRSQ